MGFNWQHFDDTDISTEYSALMRKVMANGNGCVKFPINEPAEGEKSRSKSIWSSTVAPACSISPGHGRHHRNRREAARLRASSFSASARLLRGLAARVGRLTSHRRARGLGILVDRDDEGYMLQIFTKPVEDRPTLFYEVIQRKGSRSFGKGNFKALFEAIEREQDRRRKFVTLMLRIPHRGFS